MTDLMRGNPLALLASNGPDLDGPYATHLPVVPDPGLGGAWPANRSGAVLYGHMNRANPHWEALRGGGNALLTFTGPHAYVSPTLYGVNPAAPTWDFTSVHVRGTLERIEADEAGEETLRVVQSTARTFESRFGAGWDMTGSIGYFREILPGVGAFRFTVSRADGMFKLSQEQKPEIRRRVQEDFGSRACSRHRATAKLMEELP